MTWAQRATAQLARMRGYGWTFERAWESLMDGDPPDWRRDFGIRGDTLDAELKRRETERWLRDVFEKAWLRDPATANLRNVEPVVLLMTVHPGPRRRRARLSDAA